MKGKWYKYPNVARKFHLIEIRGFIYEFECGHWCTDSVFEDLQETNPPTIQTQLF